MGNLCACWHSESFGAKGSSVGEGEMEMVLRSEIDEPHVAEEKEETLTRFTVEQTSAFIDAVSHTIPDAIPADLETAVELKIGRVALYREKPKAYVSWRTKPLDLVRDEEGNPIHVFDLISEQAKEMDLAERLHETLIVFTSKSNEEYLYQPSADQETKVKLSLDFGRVSVASSNLYALVNSLSLAVDTDHPVIRQAQERGGVILVVSKVYQSERARIQVGNLEDQSLTPVFYRTMPTNLAYQLLKLRVNENGILEPMVRNGLMPHSLSNVNMDVVRRMVSVSKEPQAPLEDIPDMGEDKDEPDNEEIHFHCGRRDFEMFHSTSYAAMFEEIDEFVRALVENSELQEEFLQLVTGPDAWSTMAMLSDCLGSIQTAVEQSKGIEGVPTAFQDLIGKMSRDRDTKEEEMKSLIISTEAFKEFNTGTMKCIVELSPYRRAEILGLIMQIPFGTSHHIFTWKSLPDSDRVYYQFLRKMGFGDSKGHLDFTSDPDVLEKLGAGITAMLASKRNEN